MSRRVAFVSVVPSPYQRDLFRALHERKVIEPHIFYLEAESPDSPWPRRELASYERILPGFWHSLGAARVHFNWSLPAPNDYDAVVLNTLMSITAQRMMRASLKRRPWIFWGEMLGQRKGVHEWLTRPLHRAAAIAAIGSRARKDYERRFPEPRHFNIPYHCELAPFLAQPRHRRDSRMVFLFCGQMIARKGLDVLLSAFAGCENARLLLVGREAELPGLMNAAPAKQREFIEYAGFQPPEKLPEFFARADAFILPSRHDGWGVVVNQALGAGLPLLCSDQVGAADDLLEENVNGAVFRSGDAAALKLAMQRLIDRPQLAGEWGAASRKKASAWTPEAGAEKWERAIAGVLP